MAKRAEAGAMTEAADDAAPRQRNKRGEGGRLRALLVEAAQGILDETGTESAITIRAVTRRAGVAPQSFYLQFASLDDLLLALYEAGFEHLHAALASAVEYRPDPAARLSELAHAYIAYALEHRGEYRSLMGSIGQQHAEWHEEELPGMATLSLLREGLIARHPLSATDFGELTTATTLLWTHLHGTAILLIDRPSFPWPPIDELIEGVVLTATLGIPTARDRGDRGDRGDRTAAKDQR
jgi:AcrR family transcriptional regulator